MKILRPRTIVFLVSVMILPATLVAQRVPVWSVCDTSHMQYDYQPVEHYLAVASPDDIASIGDATQMEPVFRYDHVVRQSTDSGRTWHELYSENVRWGTHYSAIEHPTPGLFVVAGDTEKYFGQDKNGNTLSQFTGDLLLSRDSGRTWTMVYFDTNTEIRDIKMLSASYGAAILTHVGNIYDSLPYQRPDELLVTNDAWKTWSVTPLHGIRWGIQLIAFGQSEFGTYAWSPADTMYQFYRISGNSVTALGEFPSFEKLTFVGDKIGWGVGTYWSGNRPMRLFSHTTDGGAHWQEIVDSSSPVNTLRTIAFADSLHGFAGGEVIVSTSDGGVTWHESNPPYAALLTANGGAIEGLAYPRPDFAIAIVGSTMIRFTGQTTLAAPNFVNIGLGPVALTPRPIAWTTIDNAQQYQVQLAANDLSAWQDSRHFFDTPWLDTVVTGTSLVMQNLEFNTGYYGRVRAIAGSDTSDWSQSGTWQQPIALFYTITHAAPLPPAILEPPSGSHIGTHVSMKISSIPHAVSYGVRFYYYGAYATIDTTVPDTTFDIKGIQPDAQYDVTVRANFADDSTDWSRPNYSLIADPLSTVALTPSEQNPLLFPNPASEEIRIAAAFGSIVTVFDALGRRQPVPTRCETHGIVCDIGSLAAGTYFAKVDGEHPTTMRFVVRH